MVDAVPLYDEELADVSEDDDLFGHLREDPAAQDKVRGDAPSGRAADGSGQAATKAKAKAQLGSGPGGASAADSRPQPKVPPTSI